MVEVEVEAVDEWRCAQCSERRYVWNWHVTCTVAGRGSWSNHRWRPDPARQGVRVRVTWASGSTLWVAST